jgi:cobalt-precorrin 5A hydrolase
LLRLRTIASITLKEDEEGLYIFARELGAELVFFDKPELIRLSNAAAPPGGFSSSDFVKEITGVDTVCERASLAACWAPGKLIVSKTICDDVTVAVAEAG